VEIHYAIGGADEENPAALAQAYLDFFAGG
jgi:hypothetical protein